MGELVYGLFGPKDPNNPYQWPLGTKVWVMGQDDKEHLGEIIDLDAGGGFKVRMEDGGYWSCDAGSLRKVSDGDQPT